MSRALILDFDGSVRSAPGAETVHLGDRQEAVRFGCRKAILDRLGGDIAAALEPRPDVVFMGSGDYHHVSYLLIERLRVLGARIQIVVFDNHPDNMRYPFGIHCGSWVWHVSRLPFVECIHVVGITSVDVEARNLWGNYLAPLYNGKVRYFCVNRDLGMMRRIGIRHCRSFSSTAGMLDELSNVLKSSPEPVYLSIDKDVLAPDVVQTNWDQGVMRLDELMAAIRMLRGRIVSSDVVGDVSLYRYRSRFKRFLTSLEHQPEIPEQALAQWQAQHQQVNRQLLSLLSH
jgi:arginase family enzyme